MSIVRVKPEISAAVYDEDSKGYITLSAGMEFDSTDPIVKQAGWAFASDAEVDRPARKRVTAVEVATNEPGTKRNR